MRLRFFTASCMLLAGLGWIAPLAAQAEDAGLPPGVEGLFANKVKLFTRLRPEQINAALEAIGVTYRIQSNQATGRPVWICRLGRFDAQLVVYDTDNLRDGTYDAIELATDFQAPPGDREALIERANEWNRTMRLSVAMIAPNGAAILATDRSVRAGVTVQFIQEFIRLHGALADAFAQRLTQAPTVAAVKGPKGRRVPMEEEPMPLPLGITH